MSSVAAAADAATLPSPEEFAALADYAVDDFMSEAASDVEVFASNVEVFATTEGQHGDVCAEEIRFLGYFRGDLPLNLTVAKPTRRAAPNT